MKTKALPPLAKLRPVLDSALADKTRPNYHGVFVGRGYAVATDGHRLAMVPIQRKAEGWIPAADFDGTLPATLTKRPKDAPDVERVFHPEASRPVSVELDVDELRAFLRPVAKLAREDWYRPIRIARDGISIESASREWRARLDWLHPYEAEWSSANAINLDYLLDALPLDGTVTYQPTDNGVHHVFRHADGFVAACMGMRA